MIYDVFLVERHIKRGHTSSRLRLPNGGGIILVIYHSKPNERAKPFRRPSVAGCIAAFTVLALLSPTYVYAAPDTTFVTESTLGPAPTAGQIQGLLKKARAGDVKAQEHMGDLHMDGSGVVRNKVLAAMWYSKAANAGNALAQYKIGLMYLRFEGVPFADDNDTTAMMWLGKAAQNGEQAAFAHLYYYYGQVHPDPKKMSFWQGVEDGLDQSLLKQQEKFKQLLQTAKQGDAVAQRRVALRYEKGRGIERDFAAAATWYKAAAELGDVRAQDNYADLCLTGKGVPKDPSEAAKWYQRAADKGFSRSQYSLANLYRNGHGVDQDFDQAAKLYQQAAASGIAAAQTNLGRLYASGKGLDSDPKQAASWYQKAADQDYAPALRSLGIAYQFGKGVKQDDDQAFALYTKAAEFGDVKAQENLAFLYQSGRGTKKDYANALSWYQKAAAQGSKRAQNKIGVFYQFGKGVKVDLIEAHKWYQLAADQGHDQAIANLKALGGLQ